MTSTATKCESWYPTHSGALDVTRRIDTACRLVSADRKLGQAVILTALIDYLGPEGELHDDARLFLFGTDTAPLAYYCNLADTDIATVRRATRHTTRAQNKRAFQYLMQGGSPIRNNDGGVQ